MDEWRGRFVRLRRDVTTSGGVVFTKGEVLVVTGHYRGTLSLNRPARTSNEIMRTQGHAVSGINRERDVDLLPEDPREVVKAILEGAELVAKSVGGVLGVYAGDTLHKFDPKKVRLWQSATGSGITRDANGAPVELALG